MILYCTHYQVTAQSHRLRYNIFDQITLFLNKQVGASVADPGGLRFVYECDVNFSPLPTYGVIIAQHALNKSDMMTGGMPGFDFDLSKVIIKVSQTIKNISNCYSFFKTTSCCMANSMLNNLRKFQPKAL